MTEYLTTSEGRRIAFNRSPGTGPGIVFLGGFKSDMEGTKALALEAWAQAQGRMNFAPLARLICALGASLRAFIAARRSAT